MYYGIISITNIITIIGIDSSMLIIIIVIIIIISSSSSSSSMLVLLYLPFTADVCHTNPVS